MADAARGTWQLLSGCGDGPDPSRSFSPVSISDVPECPGVSLSEQAAGPSGSTKRASFFPGTQETSFAVLWNFIISLSYVVAAP